MAKVSKDKYKSTGNLTLGGITKTISHAIAAYSTWLKIQLQLAGRMENHS